MIFKQDVLKEQKTVVRAGVGVILFVFFALILVFLFDGGEVSPITEVLPPTLFFLPLVLLNILMGFNYWEWHCVYDDKIETRCIYGIKNIVFYDKILFIEEALIPITTRGGHTRFYILNDGRKNNNSFFDINSCYNRKKFNLRIYKTPELEEFIKNHPVLKDLPMRKKSK